MIPQDTGVRSGKLPLLLMALLSLGATGASAQVARSPWDSLARSLLQELVEINTTESSGSTLVASRAMAERMVAAGFPADDVTVVPQGERKGNLVVRYRGRNIGRRPLLLLSHLDVVEANPADWTLPPFELVEREGTFYGRGVADDKDEGAIHLALLMRLRAEGFVPDRDIIVALTTDEEGGPDNGVQYLLEHHKALIDAEFAFNEGGGGDLRDGRRIANGVQASEKMFQNFLLEVTNPGGHSSQPVPENAITRLSAALVRLGAHTFPVRLNPVTTAFFERSAPLVEPEVGTAMRTLVARPDDAAAARILSVDKAYNALLRTTCVATMVDAGHAGNALPQRARATVNCRILPDGSASNVRRTLVGVIADSAVTITPIGSAVESPPSPLAPDLVATFERVTTSLWPGVPVVPKMSTGATDGLYLRNAGIPVYGVSGLFYPDTGAHGMNERIPVQAFYEGLEFMYRLVRAVTDGHAGV